MSHLRLLHASDADIEFTCPVLGCSSRYSNVNSVCSHIYRKNSQLLTKLSASSLQREESGTATATCSGVLVDLSLPESVGFDVDALLHRDGYEQKKKSSLFYFN